MATLARTAEVENGVGLAEDVESELRTIVEKQLPGYTLVEVDKVFPDPPPDNDRGVGALSQHVPHRKYPPEVHETRYYTQVGDDVFVVWVIPEGRLLRHPTDAKSLTLSRREKRVISTEG